MVGTYESTNSKGKQVPCEFTLTIESDNVEHMLNCDPSHTAKIAGTVTCLALSSSPLTVSEGIINRPFPSCLLPLFQSESWCSAFQMKMSFHLHGGKTYFYTQAYALGLALKKRQ